MSATDTHQQAISLVKALPSNKLNPVIELLERLNRHASVEKASPQESSLIEVIQRKLSSHELQHLKVLRQKLEADSITELERKTLLQLTSQLELQDAERAEAFMRLARLRQVDIQTVIQEFSPIAS